MSHHQTLARVAPRNRSQQLANRFRNPREERRHGTAVIEQVQVFTWGNLNLNYARTDAGHHPSLEEQFDSDVFLRLLGIRMSALPATLEISPLTEATRAIDVGGQFDLLRLQVRAEHHRTVSGAFTHLSANVRHRSLYGHAYDVKEQFADLRSEAP